MKARLSELERTCSESESFLDREKSSAISLQQQLTEEQGTSTKVDFHSLRKQISVFPTFSQLIFEKTFLFVLSMLEMLFGRQLKLRFFGHLFI